MKRKRSRTSRKIPWQSRPPLERMLQIHQAIRTGDYPNATKLARKLEVSTKSIHRDLDFMRDRLELPIEYDDARFGYYYTQEVSAFPALQLTEGELVAVVVAEKALQQYRGTSFEKPLLSAIRKIEYGLPDTISMSLGDIDRSISFRTRAEPILDLATFDALTKATSQHRQLEITYRKAGQAQGERRLIDPYHLANIDGEWFLFAFDHLRMDIRTFAPARIQDIRPTGRKFNRQKRFSLEERLKDSFGVHSGHGRYEVVLRFNAYGAEYVREKKWHESQQLQELKDGGIELRMTLSSLEEVSRWVLSWAGNVSVVRPPELADMVCAAARRILNL